jgi:protein TonB
VDEIHEMNHPRPDGGPTGGTGGTYEPIPTDIMPADSFFAVQREPMVLKSVKPVYPEIALKAGLEGTVFVKLWVDKTGKVRLVKVVKGEYEVLNQAAVSAAEQFVFTPAVMNSGPVSVWVGMPFKFRLADPHR